MSYRSYNHVERHGNLLVHGLDAGRVHVFPKLDGTNAVVWLDDAGQAQCGSRNRQLVDGHDNHGFRAYVMGDDQRAVALRAALKPGLVYYGEWLVPHTIKGYRDDSWRRFWIFDVYDRATHRYLPWDDYRDLLAGVDVLAPIAVLTAPTSAQLIELAKTDRTLLREGEMGEGIVLKNYAWADKFGHQPWAKIVNGEAMGKGKLKVGRTAGDVGASIEAAIAAKFVTAPFVAKTRAKCVAALAEQHGFDLAAPDTTLLVETHYRGRLIPMLLGIVYSDLVREEMWAIVKEGKNPTIDFGLLNRVVVERTKALAPDLFGAVLLAQESV